MTPEDERLRDLFLRWGQVPGEWEVLHDGRVRMVRDDPGTFTEAEVGKLWSLLNADPFPRRSAPELVRRYVSLAAIARIMGKQERPKPAPVVPETPETPAPNPSERVKAGAAAALADFAARRDADPVRAFVAARELPPLPPDDLFAE